MNAVNNKDKCVFCGLNKHPRNSCPVKDSTCNYCVEIGHYAQVFKSKASTKGSSPAILLNLTSLANNFSNKNSNGYVTLLLNNNEILALTDLGSTSSSFIDKSLVHQRNIKVIPAKGEISLANSSLTTKIKGECLINFTLDNRVYENVKVLVVGDLCADIILHSLDPSPFFLKGRVNFNYLALFLFNFFKVYHFCIYKLLYRFQNCVMHSKKKNVFYYHNFIRKVIQSCLKMNL